MQDEVAAARVAATEAYSSIKEHTADVRQTWLGWEKQGESAFPRSFSLSLESRLPCPHNPSLAIRSQTYLDS